MGSCCSRSSPGPAAAKPRGDGGRRRRQSKGQSPVLDPHGLGLSGIVPFLGVVSSCPWQCSGSCTGQESTEQKNTWVTGIEALGLVLDSETPKLKEIQKTPLCEP